MLLYSVLAAQRLCVAVAMVALRFVVYSAHVALAPRLDGHECTFPISWQGGAGSNPPIAATVGSGEV